MTPDQRKKIEGILEKVYKWGRQASSSPPCCIDQALTAIEKEWLEALEGHAVYWCLKEIFPQQEKLRTAITRLICSRFAKPRTMDVEEIEKVLETASILFCRDKCPDRHETAPNCIRGYECSQWTDKHRAQAIHKAQEEK